MAAARMNIKDFEEIAGKLKSKAFDTLYRQAPVPADYAVDVVVMDIIKHKQIASDAIIIRSAVRKTGISEGEIIKSIARLKERRVIEEINGAGQ